MSKTINKVIYVITLISTIIFMIFLIKMNVLPFKYLSLLILFFMWLYMIFTYMIIKNKKKVISFIQIILEIVIIIGTCFGSFALYKTDRFLNSFNDIEEEEADYYVIVRKDSSYETIYDLEDRRMGTYSNKDEYYEQALNNLKELIDCDYDNSSDLFAASDKLLNGKIDGLLISSFHLDILKETDEDYENQIRIIYTDGIIINGPDDLMKLDKGINDVVTIYISGIDTDGPIKKVSRSDVNILLTINTNTHQVLLTNIPRDYYVQLHGTTGTRDKLTHAGIYGINKSMNTIEDLLNINIDYYVRINFDTLLKLVEAIDGVDVYSDMSFKLTNEKYINKGMNHLNASEALVYSRARYQFASGDRKRGEHQEDIIEAIVNKITSSKVLLTNYFDIVESLIGYFQTSFPEDSIRYFVKEQLDTMPKWSFQRINLDGSGKMDYTYSMPGRKLYVMVPNQSTVTKASDAINGMHEGKTFKDLGL